MDLPSRVSFRVCLFRRICVRFAGHGISVLVAACTVVMAASAAQASLAGSADLEARTVSGHASLNKVAHLTIGIVNHGPGDPEGGAVTLDVTAPGGTVFDAATEASFA